MIYKSYLIEQNIKQIKEYIALFYGENLGLKNEIIDKIRSNNSDSEIINLTQDEILKNDNILINEIKNISLFQKTKIFLINQTNDKFLPIIKNIEKYNEHTIFLFADILDKKSKLRNYFEKSNELATVACYQDNETTIKKLILSRLGKFQGLTPFNINLIVESCNLDRMKLLNEIDKIKSCFQDKNIEKNKLEALLNTRYNDDFNSLRDQALNGNKIQTNKLLNVTVIDEDKNFYYLNAINQRLTKLKELNELAVSKNIDQAVNLIKPPIFWKDKPNFISQSKKWNKFKIKEILNKTFNLEIQLKSNSDINKSLLIKKLIVDVCNLANA
tara:strand:+ start:482 stop:1468 length:987 start_codon:yes stop_codon:yes gene_type:complete